MEIPYKKFYLYLGLIYLLETIYLIYTRHAALHSARQDVNRRPG